MEPSPTVWLDEIARDQIEQESARWAFRETGGPLFGYETSTDIVIVGSGGPGPRAVHRPWSFEPDHQAVDRAVAVVYTESQARYRYLGSWHTHPFGRPRPSRADSRAARQISQEEDVQLPNPLIVIHATLPGRRTLRDSALRAHRWSDEHGLEPAALRLLRAADRRHPAFEQDWLRLVP